MKAYELAKEVKITSKDVIERAKKLVDPYARQIADLGFADLTPDQVRAL